MKNCQVCSNEILGSYYASEDGHFICRDCERTNLTIYNGYFTYTKNLDNLDLNKNIKLEKFCYFENDITISVDRLKDKLNSNKGQGPTDITDEFFNVLSQINKNKY